MQIPPKVHRLLGGLASFVLPALLMPVITWVLIIGVGLEGWSALNRWLDAAYQSIGLTGEPERFSWSIVTLYLLWVGLPYAILVLLARRIILPQPKPSRPGRLLALPRWLLILLISTIAALVFLRIFLGHVPPSWLQSGVNQKTLSGFLVRSWTWLLIFGVPAALIAILLDYALLWLRLRKSRPE